MAWKTVRSFADAIRSRWVRAGGAEVDLTPDPGIDLAGYSVMGPMARGHFGRLWAHALAAEDTEGRRYAWVSLDLLGASRFLHERVASHTVAVGVPLERLLLSATHSHSGPGHYFGNSLFDRASAHLFEDVAGFHPHLAAWLATRIASAVEQAVATLQPAVFGFAQTHLWGTTRNAALAAFRENPEHLIWDTLWPDAPPPGLPEANRAVHPRLFALAARTYDGKMIGVQAVFGAHASTLGGQTHRFSPDWPGFARLHLKAAFPEAAVIGFTAGAAGDVTAVPWPPQHGPQVAQAVGISIGRETLSALRQARWVEQPALSWRAVEWHTCEREVHSDPSTRLAEEWSLGVAVLGGASDGATGIPLPMQRISEHFSPEDPRFPRNDLRQVLGLGLLLRRLTPSPRHLLHLVEIDDVALFTFPGEPSATTAVRAELEVRAATGRSLAVALGYANDYLGYFVTPEEYRVQLYEGASALWGRNQAAHHLARLLSHEARIHIPVAEPSWDAPRSPPRPHCGRAYDAVVRRWGDTVQVKWKVPDRIPMRVAEDGALVQLLSQGAPVSWGGLPFDDLHQPIEVAVEERFLGSDLWSARFVLPPALSRTPLELEFRSRSSISGFRISI